MTKLAVAGAGGDESGAAAGEKAAHKSTTV